MLKLRICFSFPLNCTLTANVNSLYYMLQTRKKVILSLRVYSTLTSKELTCKTCSIKMQVKKCIGDAFKITRTNNETLGNYNVQNVEHFKSSDSRLSLAKIFRRFQSMVESLRRSFSRKNWNRNPNVKHRMKRNKNKKYHELKTIL